MKVFTGAVLVMALFAESVLAQTVTEGTVSGLVYNGSGQVTQFVCKGKTFKIDTPSELWTSNVQRWKDDGIKIKITDQDDDYNIEAADTVAEV